MTRDIIFEVLMRMPNPAEKWKTYSADMKEILFNDYKASYYNLLWESNRKHNINQDQ